MTRYALIGPTYPYRGGIAHHTTLLAQTLRRQHPTLLISFSRQYPEWLFPGRSDRDPSSRPLQTDAEYLLDPLNPLSWRRTLQRLRVWQPEVVIIPWWVPFWAPVWSVLGRGVKRFAPPPRLIFICHNVLPHEEGRLAPLLPAVTRTALAPGDGFILHSSADRQVLRQLLPDARAVVTPLPTYAALGKANAPPGETAAPPGEAAAPLPVTVPDDRPLLLFAGFVRPYKGLDVLLDALPLVLEKRPIHLLVAGEFWEGTAPFQEQIERLDIGDNVTLLDQYLPNEQLAACMRRADVVVLPYRSATQSAVIQFAFGQGTPVITTDVGGLGEVVAHEETGLVVPSEDPPALAAAIERFFAGARGAAFSAAIAQTYGRFSWETFVKRLGELVETAGE